MSKPNYWVVGAMWSGGIEDQAEDFYLRGYWEMGYADTDKPLFAHRRDAIKKGDRIAIKSMNGKKATTITIRAIGIVKDVADGKVFVDWKDTGMERRVHSKGFFGTIHGPVKDKEWRNEAFCL